MVLGGIFDLVVSWVLMFGFVMGVSLIVLFYYYKVLIFIVWLIIGVVLFILSV